MAPLFRPRKTNATIPLDVRRLDDKEYVFLDSSGRDSWFYALRQSGTVLAVLSSSASDKAGGYPPLLTVSIQAESRSASFPIRSRGVLNDTASSAVNGGYSCAWLPVRLVAADDVHSNAVLLDVANRKVILFEPHGSDAQDPRQAACGFLNYYVSQQYFAAFKQLATDDLPGWSIVLPTHYQPPVFGQSISGVLGEGLGDRWCSLWTCIFFYQNSLRRVGECEFCQEVMRLHGTGQLAGTVKHWMQTRKTWMRDLQVRDVLSEKNSIA